MIPLAEEVLTVGKHKVSAGTTRVHPYVVQTPVERQVSLVQERVVVERRRPVTDKVSSGRACKLSHCGSWRPPPYEGRGSGRRRSDCYDDTRCGVDASDQSAPLSVM